MTKQDLEAYEARLSWVKALDAATEAAQGECRPRLPLIGKPLGKKLLSSFVPKPRRLQPRAPDDRRRP